KYLFQSLIGALFEHSTPVLRAPYHMVLTIKGDVVVSPHSCYIAKICITFSADKISSALGGLSHARRLNAYPSLCLKVGGLAQFVLPRFTAQKKSGPPTWPPFRAISSPASAASFVCALQRGDPGEIGATAVRA